MSKNQATQSHLPSSGPGAAIDSELAVLASIEARYSRRGLKAPARRHRLRSAFAEMHYGKRQGAKHTEIVKANSPPVKNPDLIQPGWMLRIPPLS
jgi:hypothetical protein